VFLVVLFILSMAESIQSWPLSAQAAAVFLIFAGLITCTLAVIGPMFAFARRLLPSGWFEHIIGMFWMVGLFYIVIGIFHFLSPDPFCTRKAFSRADSSDPAI
jgi:uncharacterized membrane protein YdbT with pleckstrin-like domain